MNNFKTTLRTQKLLCVIKLSHARDRLTFLWSRLNWDDNFRYPFCVLAICAAIVLNQMGYEF